MLKVVYRRPKSKTKASAEIEAWSKLIEAKWKAKDRAEAKEWIKTIHTKSANK